MGLPQTTPRGVLRKRERFEHELARLLLLPGAHVLRAREVERLLGARHADVEEPALLLEMEVAGRQRVLDQPERHLERVAAPPGRELLLDAVHEEDHGPLEALG